MKQTIDLNKHGGPIYSGRGRGAQLREKLGLDEFDERGFEVEIVVPEETYTITSSFWLGLLSPSVKSLGSKEDFLEKYRVNMPERFLSKFHYCVDRALAPQSGLL